MPCSRLWSSLEQSLLGKTHDADYKTSFGQQLRTSLLKDYYSHYIAYDALKAALKTPHTHAPTRDDPRGQRRAWTESDERSFVTQLEGELDKVYTFQRVKANEIVRRIQSSEKEVEEVLEKLRTIQEQDPDSLREGRSPSRQDKADLTEQDFDLLEADLSDIIADVHDLAKFTQLNYTGFQKIIKKHDKQTLWILKPVFAARLKAKPFFKDNYDALIVNLSRLYEIVRTRGNPAQGDSAAGGSQQNFVRETTKYWVHEDNVTELKLIILKHLPVLVFNAGKEFDAQDAAISSVYYDNPDTWELYMGRLKKTEGAEAIRLRWYGGMQNNTIFVERKTHREDWTGEKSVKARFAIKEKNVNAYLSGRMSVETIFEKARAEGKKSRQELDDQEQLAREIQYSVLSRSLVPVTRSFYTRTAFQLPGDARVRISLDTDLTMIREDNLDARTRAGSNWRRMDIGVDYPFPQLPKEDVERFPYAVLEVKLQTQAGQEPPIWVREMTESHLVEAVPRFSKFIHGTAAMFPSRIDLLPFWMPQMAVDIRKPAVQRFGINRPTASTTCTTIDTLEDESDDDDDDNDSADDQGPGDRKIKRLQSSAVNGSKACSTTNTTDQGLQRLEEARDAIQRYDLAQRAQCEYAVDMEEHVAAEAFYDNPEIQPLYDSDEEDDGTRRPRRSDSSPHTSFVSRLYRLLATLQRLSFTVFWSIFPAPRATAIPVSGAPKGFGSVPATALIATRFKAPPGKRIHVPVRVEPKVFFAVERTFLSWLEFSIVLGSIAATLLNFDDSISMASALAFTIVSCLSLLYSMILYLWRVRCIRERRAARYHDRYGPTILCVGVLTAVAINFGASSTSRV